MQLASIKPHDLAVIQGDSFVALGEQLARQGLLPPQGTMVDLIDRYQSLKSHIDEAVSKGPTAKLDPKQLRPPVERPSKIWAAAGNYRRGSSGLDDARGRGEGRTSTPQEILEMTFLKPPSAVIGPEEAIVIPTGAQTIFPEIELCVVIGKKARHLSGEEALQAVFGYTILLDVTARGYGSGKGGQGSRCVRKGFETFAPIGPCITTQDEIKDPKDLTLRLWVNEELRQSAKTDAMINGVTELVSFLSGVTTLYPGDLITTGNPDAPAFQKQLQAGDRLKAEIEGIGAMNLTVQREA
jgi:2-keto-4-pentenoate hydratase/2-oxohepta-3-ene-1,7-dioic acid hydratase in catechol pathway